MAKKMLIIGGIIAFGLFVWLFYFRVIKNQATTYQKAEKIANPTWHNEFHPIGLINIGGCIPAKPMRSINDNE